MFELGFLGASKRNLHPRVWKLVKYCCIMFNVPSSSNDFIYSIAHLLNLNNNYGNVQPSIVSWWKIKH